MEDLLGLFADDKPFAEMMRGGFRGLTDDEYLWEPVEGCWSVRPVDQLRVPPPAWAAADGYALEIAYPDPDPSPFTTIAWRLVHLTGSMRVATATLRGRRRQDGAIDDAWSERAAVPSTAAAAVRLWEESLEELQSELGRADRTVLERRERQWWDAPGRTAPVWEHVLYFGYFEPASHGAEVRLIRDLYRHTDAGATPLRGASR